jgi:hypothetical protein
MSQLAGGLGDDRDAVDISGVPSVLPVLVLATLVALPVTAPLADLPAGADPCIALTPAVVDQLRTSGALTPLLPEEISTSTLIVMGRSLTGCPPASDPDPATIRARVCPLLTAEGVEALANRFKAAPAVRADLGPERIAVARDVLQCDVPAAATSRPPAAEGAAAVETSADRGFSNTADRADRGLLRDRLALALATGALIGVLLLLVVVGLRKQSVGGRQACRRVQILHPLPRANRPRRRRRSDARDGAEVQQRLTPEEDPDLAGLRENSFDSYDELLEGLRREVTDLQRSDEARRRRPTKPDGQREE